MRNLDEQAYRAIRAYAVLQGKTVGDVISEALRAYLARVPAGQRRSSLRDLRPEMYPEGNERLSREIDAFVYGSIGDRP